MADEMLHTSTTSSSTELLEELRRQLPGGGQHRPGQLEMAAAVEEVLVRGGVLSINAPTGTGKSLAYLSALITRKRVGPAVVATSSIALQDQLSEKDLPFIASHSPTSVRWAILKGRSNYLCRASLEDALKSRGNDELLLASKNVEAELSLDDIVSWAELTETGDRAELPTEPAPALWESVSMTSEGCPGAKSCPFGEVCFAERAVAAARDADVIVVNTHLYAINVSLWGKVLPEHDAVVIDEAHEIEHIFSSVLGTEVRPSQLAALARRFKSVVKDDRIVDRLFAASTHMQAVLGSFEQDQRLVGGLRSSKELSVVVDEAEVAIALARKGLDAVAQKTSEKVSARIFRLRGAMNAFSEALSGVCSSSDEVVVWVEGGCKVRSAPLDVSRALRSWFWARTIEPDTDWEEGVAPPRSVIIASATLSPSTAGRLGATGPTVLSVESPFDHRSNALLYVPDLPDPRTSPTAWRAALIGELKTLMEAAGGRTLALFTSIAAMHEVAEAIAAAVPYPILVQGTLPKRALLARFAEDERACLFGTRSFFQGVDVPGSSLSLVALDRLPFPRPDDPLIAARSQAAGSAGFARVVIPMTSVSLAQAAGRLIRTDSDRGVVAVFDPRLARAAYRTDLLAALPPMRRTRAQCDAIACLSEIAKEGDRGVGNHAA